MKKFRYLEHTIQLSLDHKACIGCGMCVTVCPHRVMRLNAGKAEIIDNGGCMECGACVRNCPVDALYVNPDDGCGCAAYIVNSWIHRISGKSPSNCGC